MMYWLDGLFEKIIQLFCRNHWWKEIDICRVADHTLFKYQCEKCSKVMYTSK